MANKKRNKTEALKAAVSTSAPVNDVEMSNIHPQNHGQEPVPSPEVLEEKSLPPEIDVISPQIHSEETSNSDGNKPSANASSPNTEPEMTNVRPLTPKQKLVADLKDLAKNDRDCSFDIGDLVEVATTQYKMKVNDLVADVGLSRQRLTDCRVTAVAFRAKARRNDVPFHFFTLAARAATKFEIDADSALQGVMQKGLKTVREVSRHFAQMALKKGAGKALENAGLLVASHGDLLDKCHLDDFRTVVARLKPGTVKLVIADPAYDGKRKSSSSATIRGIDGDTATETQEDIQDLLRKLADKMAKGGTLVLFRPGAAIDPAWLSEAISSNGWQCDWALTWNKNKAKLGRSDAPYGIASERILILSLAGEKLTSHNESPRSDILDFQPIQPRHADADPHHQHEKPLDLMKFLIGKHTHEGELVVEPFGGTGPACQAAVEINRHWLYCETKMAHFEIAAVRIAARRGPTAA